MRIQHNIMSMNAYRNYNNNASALSKNLEKLSSGYKINRAGDDAAGLAISEKMRAQIKGLEAAQKNVKDGISLVKTAEGAMQEIQDMLSRMKYLATQSSNGTYDDDVDRKALQDEVDQLNSEINRIADSANFNGTKLLDGSLAAEGGTTTVDPKGIEGVDTHVIEATKNTQDITLTNVKASTKYADGDKITLSLSLSDGTAMNVNLNVKVDDKGVTTLVGDNGKVYKEVAAATGGVAANASDGDISDALAAALKDTKLGESYKFDGTATAGKITMTAKEAGGSTVSITGVGYAAVDKDGATIDTYSGGTLKDPKVETTTKGEDDITALVGTEFTFYDGTNADKAVFTINGQKFAIGALDQDLSKLGKDVTFISVTTGSTAAGATDDDWKQVCHTISQKTGLKLTYDATGYKLDGSTTATAKSIKIESGTSGTASKGGLQLQIGDTSDDFNQLKVTVGDLHANAIGVGTNVDISSIDGASAAIDKIKNAINTVSAIRGKLGATQNRLEHTQNNLSVMTENIQDAESTIRDTDVADEMMAYTKNNILIQSAQAMLAQANSVPQGVLQLLQ